MKKIIIRVVLLLTLTLIPAQAFAGEPATLAKDFHVTYNGVEENFEDGNGQSVTPIVFEGTTYLPVRAVAGLAGLDVSWDKATNTVALTSDGLLEDYTGSPNDGQPVNIIVEPDSTLTITMDGAAKTFKDGSGKDVFPFIYDGTTYLPVRAVCDMVGIPVSWDANSKTILLGKELKEVKPAAEIPEGAKVLTGADLLPQSQTDAYEDGAFHIVADPSIMRLTDLYFPADGYQSITFTVTTGDAGKKEVQDVSVSGWNKMVDQYVGTPVAAKQEYSTTKTYTADISGYGAVEISVGNGWASNAVVTNIYLSKSEQSFGKVTDKNIDIVNKMEAPYIVNKKDMDPFWEYYLSDIEIQNEWMYPGSVNLGEPCDIAIFGALKSNPKQGTIIIFCVNNKNEIVYKQQFLAPYEGGALSVMDEPSAKDFVMKVQDETGRIYSFNYFNGFS